MDGAATGSSRTGEADDGIAALRAREYLLIGTLLRSPISAAFLAELTAITGDPSPLGMAHLALADAARRTDVTTVGREYFELFIGVGRGEILPYASFYLTGFLHERPLARVRQDLAALGLVRRSGNHDPEDHIATLLETMALLAEGDDPEAEARFFTRHVAPWAPKLFADLGVAPSAVFYKAVATLGLTFLEIESQAFTIPDTATSHDTHGRTPRAPTTLGDLDHG